MSPRGWASIESMDNDTGVSNTDWITNDALPRFWIQAFDVDPGDTVVVSWVGGGGGTWHQAQYDAATDLWYYEMTTPLSPGNHVVRAALMDSAGQRGVAGSGQFISILPPPDFGSTIDAYVDNVGQAQGDFGSAVPTDDRTLILKGTADVNFRDALQRNPSFYSLILYKDGVRIGEITSIDRATGQWVYVLDHTNAQEFIDHGEQGIFTVRVEDIAGGLGDFSSDFVVDVNLNVGVDFLTTRNQTPTLTGDFAFEILTQKGEYVEVTVNGKTYSSTSGQVILDDATGKWQLQIPAYDPIPAGIYDVVAILHRADGTTVVNDPTIDELTILGWPKVTIDSYVDDVGRSQGEFGSGVPTDDRTLTLKGKVDADFLADLNSSNPEFSLSLTHKHDDPNAGHIWIGVVTNIDPVTGEWEYVLNPNLFPDFIDHGERKFFYVRVSDSNYSGPDSPPFIVEVNLSLEVDFQTTTNHTPLLTGDFAFEVLTQKGEYVEVSVNGKTYSSQTRQVILDDATGKWQLQIPASDAIPTGVYDIVAILHRADGTTVVNDNTVDELTILGVPLPPPPPVPPVNVGKAPGSNAEKYTAITLNDDGQWSVATNGYLMDQRATDSYNLGNFEFTKLAALDRLGGQNATFIDINRDGLMDVIINDADGQTGQQVFINQGGGAYYSSQIGSSRANDFNLDANTRVEYGGVIGFDKQGTGYVDIAYGDARPYGSGNRGWDSQIVINVDGSLTSMTKDRYFTNAKNGSGGQASLNWGNAQAAQEISGVDLNNDGTVDLIFHANTGSSTVKLENGRSMGTSNNEYRLVVASNNGDGSYRTSQVINEVFQNGKYDNYSAANGISMTWADFDGDGYMDLFVGRGRQHNSKNGSFYGRPHGENESRILFNDGHGNLASTKANGVGQANKVHWMGDNLAGGASLAVDWNGDGKMDIIELPGFSDRNGVKLSDNTGQVNLYTNISSGSSINFSTSNLLGGNNTIGINGTVNTGPGKSRPTTRPTNESDFVTGGVIADLDWDGALDMMIFTRMGQTQTIMNNNQIADGTALHLRIVDEQGVNSFFGNTVQLIDSSGKVVAVQIINPQSGNQTNDSTGLVHFYGLDPNETYSAVLLRNVNGQSADVGGVARVGGNVIEHVNASWGDLRPGAANQAHILTAESDTNVANATIGKGIIGTGYNDTFYATKGTDSYDGAGGTVVVQGVKQWSATGGVDIIDFKLAGNQSVTVDLNLTSYQDTGFNTVRLVNIEGVSGGDGNDTFIGDGQDNVFNGRGGDDTFYLNGGHDTLVYELLDGRDDTGGNGHDTVYGFTLGNLIYTREADHIDLSNLLIGYQAGVSDLSDFVSVRTSGSDTILSVDIDGKAGVHGFADMITFANMNFDLAALVNNQQIIV